VGEPVRTDLPMTVDDNGVVEAPHHPAGAASADVHRPSTTDAPDERQTGRVAGLVRAIRDGDDQMVEQAVLRLSRSKRALAPLALLVGAFVMLFVALRLLLTNWRLTIVQVLPAMWIWLAMLDLKAHVLRGREFLDLRGPIVVVLVLVVTAITTAAFVLNAVFAFTIATPGPPKIRPAFAQVRSHWVVITGSGAVVGFALGLAAVVFERWGVRWFALSMSVVIGVMMFCYVAIPSRLLGLKTRDTSYTKRDQMAAAAIGGMLGAVVCTPPYLLGRLGVLMLGSSTLLVPGIILLVIGFALQAGATGSVTAIKMSAKLAVGRPLLPTEPTAPHS